MTNRREEGTETTVSASAESLIDLERYPIHRLASEEGQRLIRTCRRQLAETGVCLLPGFTTSKATAMMVAQTDEIVSQGYVCESDHNVYLESHDDAFPPDHPRRRLERTSLNSIPYDRIPEGHGLRMIYEWDPLTSFIGAAISSGKMFRMGDPLAALTVNVMAKDQNHGWHFDESETTITLMLQSATNGGNFEYIPQLRGLMGEEYPAVARLLAGDRENVRTLEVNPGTLIMFAGHNAIHRVEPVVGNVTRYVACLCYKSEPGVRNSAEVQRLFYGRTA